MRISNPQVFGGGKLITVDETNEKLQLLKTEIEDVLKGSQDALSEYVMHH